MGHICLSSERQTQHAFPYFDWPFLCLLWGCNLSAVSERCLLLILIYLPVLHPLALEVSKGPVLGVCMGLHLQRWCQLNKVSKDRCAEDKLCHEYRHSKKEACAVLHKRLLSLHMHTQISLRFIMWRIWGILCNMLHSYVKIKSCMFSSLINSLFSKGIRFGI